MKKLKWFKLKLEENFEFSIEANRPQPYRGREERVIAIPMGDARFPLLERLYRIIELERKKVLFFDTYMLPKGSIGFELCEACWRIL